MSATAPAHGRRLPSVLLILTLTSGLIDAVSYLGLGHVFTANMTGNIVLLGFGLAGAGGLPVLAPVVSLLSFLVGAAAGGRIGFRLAGRQRHLGVALGIEATLLSFAALLAALTSVQVGSGAAYVVIALLAIAMGLRNATVRKLAVPDLTTTVLTLTITGLVADSPLAGGGGKNSGRRLGAVLCMAVGALIGALLEKHSLAVPLVVTAALTCTALTVHVSEP